MLQNISTSLIHENPVDGFYGIYGGAFIPEMLFANISQLQSSYLEIIESEEFLQEYYQVLQGYAGRPTPLYLAKRLSAHLGFTVYLKREDLLHTGAHKLNNTIGQIILAKKLGKTRIIAETGAGQHGVATATVCAREGMPCVIYMGEEDMRRQAPNVARMRMLGAEVRAVISGSKTLKDATNEAMRDWIQNPVDTHYIIGSVVGPAPFPDLVARLQSVISKEIKKQLQEETSQDTPTGLIACVGGGSNAAGTFYHFIREEGVQLIGVEAAGKGVNSGQSAASLALGRAGVLHGAYSYCIQNSDGQIEEAHCIAAGLDYPGIGPMHSYLKDIHRAEYISVTDEEALAAAIKLCELEGIIPAIESAHALAALHKISAKTTDCWVVCLSGRGDKDLQTYMKNLKYDI